MQRGQFTDVTRFCIVRGSEQHTKSYILVQVHGVSGKNTDTEHKMTQVHMESCRPIMWSYENTIQVRPDKMERDVVQ